MAFAYPENGVNVKGWLIPNADNYTASMDILRMHRMRLTLSSSSTYKQNSTREVSLPAVVILSRVERFGDAGDTSSISVNQCNQRVAMTWLSGSNSSGIGIAPMWEPESEDRIGKL